MRGPDGHVEAPGDPALGGFPKEAGVGVFGEFIQADVTGRLKQNATNHLVVRVDNAPRLTWLPGASTRREMQPDRSWPIWAWKSRRTVLRKASTRLKGLTNPCGCF